MINMPPIQNQDNLPVQEQVKNIRKYLYQLAQDMQRELNQIEQKMNERK